jgi:hypothetical protein
MTHSDDFIFLEILGKTEAHLPTKERTYWTTWLLRKVNKTVGKTSSRYARSSRTTKQTERKFWTFGEYYFIYYSMRHVDIVWRFSVFLNFYWFLFGLIYFESTLVRLLMALILYFLLWASLFMKPNVINDLSIN